MQAVNITEKEDDKTGEIIELRFDIQHEKRLVGHYEETWGQPMIRYVNDGNKILRPIVEERGLEELVSELLSTREEEFKEHEQEIDDFEFTNVDWDQQEPIHKFRIESEFKSMLRLIRIKTNMDIPMSLLRIQHLNAAHLVRCGYMGIVPVKGLKIVINVATIAQPKGNIKVTYVLQNLSNNNSYQRETSQEVARMAIRKINKLSPEERAKAEAKIQDAVDIMEKYKINK